MINQNRIDTVWSLYNAVRGVTTSDKAVEAIAVLKKLSEIYEESCKYKTEKNFITQCATL